MITDYVDEVASDVLFREALLIAESLCDSAVWTEGTCTWVVRDRQISYMAGRAVTGRCNATLYRGTAGIALFLAAAYKATGNERFRATAIGAATAALSRRVELKPLVGLYLGEFGAAYASWLTALECGTDSLRDAAYAAVLGATRSALATRTQLVDIMSGVSGCIPLWLTLSRYGDSGLFGDAVAYGLDTIRQTAIEDGLGISWPAESDTNRRYTGYAHGTSGIADCLLSAHSHDPDCALERLIDGAFHFEDACYSNEHRNWITHVENGRPVPMTGEMACQWCSGAPGTALVRLRGAQVLHRQELAQDAVAGLATTIDRARSSRRDSFEVPLCHGRAGLGDVILIAASRTPEVQSQTAVDIGLECHHRGEERRITARGRTMYLTDNPGLLTGVAGLGLFYLRLAGKTNFRSPLQFW
jgi:lantibiotic modifying enzyme